MGNTFVVSMLANKIFAIISICGSLPWKLNWAAGCMVSRKGIPLATKVHRRAPHTGHSFNFCSAYPMSKKGESFRGYIMEILSHDKNIKTC
jgi:hypothetical protein